VRHSVLQGAVHMSCTERDGSNVLDGDGDDWAPMNKVGWAEWPNGESDWELGITAASCWRDDAQLL